MGIVNAECRLIKWHLVIRSTDIISFEVLRFPQHINTGNNYAKKVIQTPASGVRTRNVLAFRKYTIAVMAYSGSGPLTASRILDMIPHV